MDEIRSRRLPPACLTLEITETAAADLTSAVKRLRPLQSLGIRISVDDFGSGYTSLSALPEMSLDEIKVDQQFVRRSRESDNVLVYQLTFAVNSLGHRIGQRRFETNDASHNNWWLALATLGEGWHNNHHRFPAGARSGFNVWELDPTWLILRGLQRIGVVHDLGPVPPTILADSRRRAKAA
jgi:hypothetical protein